MGRKPAVANDRYRPITALWERQLAAMSGRWLVFNRLLALREFLLLILASIRGQVLI